MAKEGGPRGYLECDTRFIPAHYQPATVLDLALGRGLKAERILHGTGMAHEHILSGTERISPQQFQRLLVNLIQQLRAEDSSFLLGQQWLPGHYGDASHAVQQALNLREALQRLVQLQPLLWPLMRLRLREDAQYLWLEWASSFGTAPFGLFMLEASMAAVAHMSRWLAGKRLPWEFYLAYAKPRHIEQYWVYLGEPLHFASALNQMRLPRACAQQAWPQTAVTAGQVALQAGLKQLASLPAEQSLLDALHDYLVARVQSTLGLEEVAHAFAMSPATLKRKLHKHGSGFQQLLDNARASVALELYQSRGYNSDEVAQHLNFTDRANFRRAIKRWTGHLPSELYQHCADGV